MKTVSCGPVVYLPIHVAGLCAKLSLPQACQGMQNLNSLWHALISYGLIANN